MPGEIITPRCSAALCHADVYAKGHCSRHYRQLLRTGALSADRVPRECAVPGCGRASVTRGWCHGHYVRWNRSGDVRADEPLPRDVIDTCVVEGSGRGTTSATYCRTHYNRGSCTATPSPVAPFAS